MKILYAIQGTCNGHVSRAREIIPYLKKYGELDLLVSGTQAEVGLEDPVKYRFHGFGFVFGKTGGVDILETMRQFRIGEFIRDLKSLPVNDYDLVINDFEPVTAWACKLRRKNNVALSHQSAYISPKTPQLKGFHWGKIIMNNYAPANAHIGFHFKRYDDFIYTPVIRSEIRKRQLQNFGHYTVYLPAYSDEFIIHQVEKHPNISWEIFSKHSTETYVKANAQIIPVNNEKFQNSLATCKGFLTGGGFEAPAEALYLKKKVLAVPMNNQYEQQCNALALEELGVPVIWNTSEFTEKLKTWVENDDVPIMDFPDETDEIISRLVSKYVGIK